jgi:hypothetical protein
MQFTLSSPAFARAHPVDLVSNLVRYLVEVFNPHNFGISAQILVDPLASILDDP